MRRANCWRLPWGVGLIVWVQACASVPPPKALEEARSVVNAADRRQLLGSRPQLIAKADAAYARAREAHERGDDEAAALLATQAIHRYKTAREFTRRDETRAMAKVMVRQERRAQSDAEAVANRQQELARFAEMEKKIGQLNDELGGLEAAARSDLQEAKKGLFAARRRQAEALRAGAVERAPKTYEEGRVLVESSLESLNLGLVQEARESATLALGRFDQAIREAEEAAHAAAEQAQTQGGEAVATTTRPAMEDEPGGVAEDPNAETDARRAIEQADQLRLEALRAGRTVRELEGADQWLDEAYQALREERLSAAHTHGRRAASMYAAMIRATPRAPAVAAGDDLRRAVEDRLVRIRFARSELLGREADRVCGAAFKEFESILALAQERFDREDYMRAHEFLVRAEERNRRCEEQLRAAVGAAVIATPSAAQSDDGRARAAEAIQQAQTALASTKARGVGAGSAAEAETLVASAERWYARGEYARAEAMAARAAQALAAAQDKVVSSAREQGVTRAEAARALRAAQQELAAYRRRGGAAPAGEEAAALLAYAERWFERGAYEQVSELSSQASAALSEPPSARPAAASAPGPAEGDAAKLSPRERAEQALAEAQEAVTARSSSAMSSDDPSRRRAAGLLEAAERWYDRGAFARAERLAVEATQSLNAADELPGHETGAGSTQAPEAGLATPAPAPAPSEHAVPKEGAADAAAAEGTQVDCDDVWRELEETRELATRSKGQRLSVEERRALDEALGLVAVAKRRLGEKKCLEARGLVGEARAIVFPLPRGVDGTPRERRGRTGVAQDAAATATATDDAPGNKEGTSSEDWANAYSQVKETLRLRDRARQLMTEDTRGLYESGNRLLTQVQRDYKAGRYEAAGQKAEQAAAKFRTVIEAGARQREARITEAVRRSAAGRKDVPQGWEAGYRSVYRALALQEEAKAAAPEEGRESLGAGDAALAKARAAWQAKQYAQAAKFAAAATAAYEDALRGRAPEREGGVEKKAQPEPARGAAATVATASAPAAETAPPADLELKRLAEYRKADAALREALIVASVCEQQRCAERDLREHARAQSLLASAQRALKERDYAYVAELSGQAKDALNAILATPRRDTAVERAEVNKEQRLAAQKALREATIQYKLCQRRGCEGRDQERWLRASELLPAATAAAADGRYGEAAQLASEALDNLKGALEAKPVFRVPPQARNVFLEGDQLRVSPPIQFAPGKATLTPESRPLVDELAQVLRVNAGAVKAVRVLGFTDNRGNPQRNRALSAQRARAVVQALRAAGAGDVKMTFEGKGAESPIADNRTPEGRRANRRVEFHLELL